MERRLTVVVNRKSKNVVSFISIGFLGFHGSFKFVIMFRYQQVHYKKLKSVYHYSNITKAYKLTMDSFLGKDGLMR